MLSITYLRMHGTAAFPSRKTDVIEIFDKQNGEVSESLGFQDFVLIQNKWEICSRGAAFSVYM